MTVHRVSRCILMKPFLFAKPRTLKRVMYNSLLTEFTPWKVDSSRADKALLEQLAQLQMMIILEARGSSFITLAQYLSTQGVVGQKTGAAMAMLAMPCPTQHTPIIEICLLEQSPSGLFLQCHMHRSCLFQDPLRVAGW